jgi:cyclic-di-AMP phosphodiesterase PgpH
MDAPKKKAITRRQRLAAVLILAVTVLVTYALVAFAVTPVRYDIEAGDISPTTITATRKVDDTISTEEAKAKAKAAISPVYTVDESVTADTEHSISGYFDSIDSSAAYLKEEYVTAQVNSGNVREQIEKDYDVTKIDWKNFITAKMRDRIRQFIGDQQMSDEALISLAAMSSADISSMRGNVLGITAISLDGGIIPERLQAEKDGIKREIANMYPDANQQYLAYLPVFRYLNANMLYDAAATTAKMNEAADKVETIKYEPNQTVVTKGEKVTEAQLAVLKDLGVVGAEQDNTLYIGMFLYVASIFIIYAVYLFQFETETLAETRKLVMLCTIIAVAVGLAVPLGRLDTRIITVFFGSMLACVLVSQRSALALTVLLSLLAGALSSWDAGLLSLTALRTILISCTGGFVAVFALYKQGYRASLIYSGLIAGAAGAVIALTADMMGTAWASLDAVLLDCSFAVGSGLLGGVLAIGTQPLWEAAFRVSTPARLVELSDPNHPLLKRLVVKAPGTYYHSVLTANLAEAGAEAVGANALLCRVGAYYHDVGKLKEPGYFKENQKDTNPHDLMDPRESAKVITEHLTFGMELAKKYKLPRDVQRIVAQHHGDAKVPYFVHKAQEAGIKTDDTVFRYKGTKPSSKESAVVMLADCVEAAVKSLDDQGLDQIKEMVSRIIRQKYNEGQLDDCPLGRKELNALAKAFAGVYEGAFHERIKYPQQEVTDA